MPLYKQMKVVDLKKKAKKHGLKGYSKMKKAQLVSALTNATGDQNTASGEVMKKRGRKLVIVRRLEDLHIDELKRKAKTRGIIVGNKSKAQLLDELHGLGGSYTNTGRKTRKPGVKKYVYLYDLHVNELRRKARNRRITGFGKMKKAELIAALVEVKGRDDTVSGKAPKKRGRKPKAKKRGRKPKAKDAKARNRNALMNAVRKMF